ncbi:TPA: HNH endonuclease [Shigella flexneri]|nr:HNH endonuclease [Shigella flexneri]
MDAPLRGEVSAQDRFWAKVDRSGTCWEWTAQRNGDGYGRFTLGGRDVGAHRVSYEWENDPIPDGMQIDHTCHNPGCVNPAHLRLATYLLNGQNRDGAYANSSTGVRGVSWDKRRRKWCATVRVNWRTAYFKRFNTLGEAEAAITAWRRENLPYSEMDKRKEAA